VDNSIWATWYDLPEDGRDAFFDWLHGTHLPALVARPGYLWAASYEVVGESPAPPERRYDPERDGTGTDGWGDIGMGSRFIQLVAAPAPRVFFNPAWTELPETTSNDAAAMLARRQGTRHAILLEEARVDGPEVATRPVATATAPVIQMGSFRLKTQDADFALAAWYGQDRLVAMAGVPGCVGIRKMISVAGWAKHSPIYEFVSLDARNEYFKESPMGPTTGDRERMVATLSQTLQAPGSPYLAKRLWPAVA
jgi:hypothetical protein